VEVSAKKDSSVLNLFCFVESPGKQAAQESVLSTLGLRKEEKGLATRAVKHTFSTASINRRKGAYSNIRKGISFEINSEKDKILVDTDSEIGKIQSLIARGNSLLDDIIARYKLFCLHIREKMSC
jgi:hypothetical protein